MQYVIEMSLLRPRTTSHVETRKHASDFGLGLLLAASRGKLSIVQYLYEQGADLDVVSEEVGIFIGS